MKLLLAVILVSLCVLSVDSALLEGSIQEELHIYEGRIRVLYRLLAEECPGVLKSKRQVPLQHQSLSLRVQKEYYARLLKELHDCTKSGFPLSTSLHTTKHPLPALTTEQTTTTTEVKPTTTTKVKPTTTTEVKPTTTTEVKPTKLPQPMECQQATNYTQSWRRDHNGSDIRPGGPNSRHGWACDLDVSNTEWFRFTGEAGNRMLDKCPKENSCGTQVAHWTDAEMPKVVGVESTVDVYGVAGTYCKWYTRQVKVMRCSRDTEHDFIYKQTHSSTGACADAFCGML